jgi:hypothetical protein
MSPIQRDLLALCAQGSTGSESVLSEMIGDEISAKLSSRVDFLFPFSWISGRLNTGWTDVSIDQIQHHWMVNFLSVRRHCGHGFSRYRAAAN